MNRFIRMLFKASSFDLSLFIVLFYFVAVRLQLNSYYLKYRLPFEDIHSI